MLQSIITIISLNLLFVFLFVLKLAILPNVARANLFDHLIAAFFK